MSLHLVAAALLLRHAQASTILREGHTASVVSRNLQTCHHSVPIFDDTFDDSASLGYPDSWYANYEEIGVRTSNVVLSEHGGQSGDRYAIFTGRTETTDGPRRTVDLTCLDPNKEYVLTASAMLIPPHGSQSDCHFLHINCLYGRLVSTQTDGTETSQLVGYPGPKHPDNAWFELAIHLTSIEDIATAINLDFEFKGPEAGVDVAIDDVALWEVDIPTTTVPPEPSTTPSTATGARADKLDEAIASAIFKPPSDQCQGSGTYTTFSAEFTPSTVSNWNVQNAHFEEDVFEVDMMHANNDAHQAWTMRIGKGGQISSLIGAFGESIANQAMPYNPWVDLVTQTVSVNLNRNNKNGYESYPHFIHQAGSYMKDSEAMPPPFYSPKLALDCSGNQCSTVNWGQQAHVPTVHRSDILYYSKYRDCGNGLIEYDQVIHHYGDDPFDGLNYFSTPWSAVRTSTLRGMLVANTTGVLEKRPTGLFSEANVLNLDQTGGFTTFTQQLPFELNFCVDTTADTTQDATAIANVPCDDAPGTIPLQLKSKSYGPAMYAADYPRIKMELCDLDAPIKIGFGSGLTFTNDRNAFSFKVKNVVHWCWQGKYTYFFADDISLRPYDINQQFNRDDTITISRLNAIAVEDNLALTFVHGRNPEFTGGSMDKNGYRAKSRMRYGKTGNAERDGTVWGTNFIGNVNPTETYFNRKYMIIDKLVNMQTRGVLLDSRTFEDVAEIDELNEGVSITLYHDGTTFDATIGDDSCPGFAEACVGSSTPKDGHAPLFYITCGSASYVGKDRYHFAPTGTDNLLKPYICDGEPTTTRPTWKLLGFFEEGSCDVLSSHVYIADGLCHSEHPAIL